MTFQATPGRTPQGLGPRAVLASFPNLPPAPGPVEAEQEEEDDEEEGPAEVFQGAGDGGELIEKIGY